MKKLALSALVVGMIGFVGCANNKPALQPQSECNLYGPNTPAWVCKPEVEGAYTATGDAAKTAAGISFQTSIAAARARSALARQISIDVATMIKDFTQTTGVASEQTVDAVSSEVSKQVASKVLRGSKIINRWRANDGTLVVLVGMPKDEVQKIAKEATISSFKKDKALYQKFLADKADKELEKAVQNLGNK
jgi:hypothetical protein